MSEDNINDDEDKPRDLIILGRLVGTSTGWDQQDTMIFSNYDFVPGKGCSIPAAKCVNFDFETGKWSTSNDGETVQEGDIIYALQGCENKAPEDVFEPADADDADEVDSE